MRDIGFDYYWDDKFTTNLFSRGFEYEKNETYEVLTTFESFEHFVNPMEEIENLLSISKTIIFSTDLLPHPTPEPQDWWYYGLDHGQHISFYSSQTFEYIANKYNLNYYNLGSLKILTNKKIPFYAKTILKFTRFGLHKLLQRKSRSKVWKDHLLKLSRKQY
jgi:hypothetical protein